MGCIKSSGTIKITTFSETGKNNELGQKKILSTCKSSSESDDSDSDISSYISSLNISPVARNNSFIIEKN